MLKPNCFGKKYVLVRFRMTLHAILKDNRRNVFPIAIGLTPPSFLVKEIKRALYKQGQMLLQTLPCAIKLQRAVIAIRRRNPAFPAEMEVKFLMT